MRFDIQARARVALALALVVILTAQAADAASTWGLSTSGNVTAATITASTQFSGPASGLTSIPAGNLTGSHTLPDGVLSANVPLLNASNIFNMTAVASTAETITTWSLSDDATSKVTLANATGSNNAFAPIWSVTASSTFIPVRWLSKITSDTVSGTNPAYYFDAALAASGAVANRLLAAYANNSVTKWSLDASGNVAQSGYLQPGGTSVKWTSGAGTPESSVTAPVGSLYTRTDGGAATTLYVKESGTGNTGWVAK